MNCPRCGLEMSLKSTAYLPLRISLDNDSGRIMRLSEEWIYKYKCGSCGYIVEKHYVGVEPREVES
jgi:DNA-directed RNA polymerase subunit RPC12/RpoP